jgi:tRNA A-37 threonylcarbamoyl transferase component Bud32/predicted nucleotidyltransferase
MQSVINETEKKKLLELVKNAIQDYELVACCIYGSKVAGYARPDSDYDLLVILKDYKELIKYVYEHGNNGLDASILIVDSDMLIKDAEKAALGEFVIGRLLHPYEPLINNEYLKEVEVTYKKRVIIETINNLANKSIFYKEFIIPIRYFLLAKIKERSKIYPHAVYSYIKTYTAQNASKNLAISIAGFKDALKILESEGYIRFYDDNSIIINKDIKKKVIINNILNGIYAYLVHFYAGRDTLRFFRGEARSKMKRKREITSIDKEFIEPESVLYLKDVSLLYDDWLTQVIHNINKDKTKADIKISKLGDIYSTTSLYVLNDTKVVVKHYASVKSLKWIALNFWMLGVVKLITSSRVRQLNEYKAFRILRELGINVPKIIGVSYNAKITVIEYIEGITLDCIINDILSFKSNDLKLVKMFGDILYNIHKYGYMLIDTKPSNIIVKDDKLYIVDLEQFRIYNNYSWDLICFLYYSLKFIKNNDRVRDIVRGFIDGYTDHKRRDCKYIIKDMTNKKYLLSFYPVMIMDTVFVIWDEINKYISTWS